MTRFMKANKYRVVKPGVYLSGMKHLGGSAFTNTRHDVNVGDIIEFVANFIHDGFRGEFEPNSWGIPVKGYLEETK